MPQPEKVMEFVQDERFAEGPVWMLNLLKYEDNGGRELYDEYAARATQKIDTFKTQKASAGLQVYSQQAFVITSGQTYDSVAIM